MFKKIYLIPIISLLLLSSCKVKSYREKNASYFDFSAPLNFIESNIINSDNNKFKIEIISGRAANHLKSELAVKTHRDFTKTITDNFIRKLVDTSFTLSKKQLLDEINYQKNNTKNMVVFAGGFQHIKISRNDAEMGYPTTRVARYLMELLEKGKTHYQVNTTVNNLYNL